MLAAETVMAASRIAANPPRNSVYGRSATGLIATALYVLTGLALGWRWPVAALARGLALLLPLGLAYTAYSESAYTRMLINEVRML